MCRYTDWVKMRIDKDNNRLLPRIDKVVARELYDLFQDPDETKNIAGQADMRHVMQELRTQLWKKVYNRRT